jgi:hypothetical protein
MPSINDLLVPFLSGSAPTQTNAQQQTSLQNSPTLASSNIVALTSPTLVRAGNTRIFSYNIQNPNAAAVFLQFFNAASVGAVTLGTTTPTDWLAIPPSGVLDGFWGYSPMYPAGVVVAATTTPNGATLATTGLPVSLGII